MLAIRWERPACQRGGNNWKQRKEETQAQSAPKQHEHEVEKAANFRIIFAIINTVASNNPCPGCCVCTSLRNCATSRLPPDASSLSDGVNTGSIIKGLSLPCSPSSLLSANACICNVPEAALSPPATWIHCQPAVHGGALIWRQAFCVPRWAAEKSDAPPMRLVSPTSSKRASSSPPRPPWLWRSEHRTFFLL